MSLGTSVPSPPVSRPNHLTDLHWSPNRPIKAPLCNERGTDHPGEADPERPGERASQQRDSLVRTSQEQPIEGLLAKHGGQGGGSAVGVQANALLPMAGKAGLEEGRPTAGFLARGNPIGDLGASLDLTGVDRQEACALTVTLARSAPRHRGWPGAALRRVPYPRRRGRPRAGGAGPRPG
jgi:hypothetical protein